MLDGLYEDIGIKIKKLAKWIFIIEAICAIITGWVFLGTDEDFTLYGLLTMVLGPIIAWVGSWILYAFGELVEDVHTLRNNSKEPTDTTQSQATPSSSAAPLIIKPATTVSYIECCNCRKQITHYPCEHCGHSIEEKEAPYWCGKCGYLGPFANKCPKCNSGIKIYNTKKK